VERLAIIGAGGFGRETAEAVRAANDQRPVWELVGFLDDGPGLAGTQVDGIPVLGPVAMVDELDDVQFLVCVGSAKKRSVRKQVVESLGLPPERYATVVHPAAVIPPSATVGPGTVILAASVATAPVEVGAHVVVMPAVVLTHDDVVADYATFASGARLAGRVHVGEGAYVGAGALVREDCHIGEWALVGMGAVVVDPVPAGEVWAGVPARRLS
jgi:sugar O-acyltransferase (sialic acid O-acetyltransferase NeuD family)